MVPRVVAPLGGAGRLASAGARGGGTSLRRGSSRVPARLPAPERATRHALEACVVARGGHRPANWDVSPTVGETAAHVAPKAGPTHPTATLTGSGNRRFLVLPHFSLLTSERHALCALRLGFGRVGLA